MRTKSTSDATSLADTPLGNSLVSDLGREISLFHIDRLVHFISIPVLITLIHAYQYMQTADHNVSPFPSCIVTSDSALLSTCPYFDRLSDHHGTGASQVRCAQHRRDFLGVASEALRRCTL